MSANTGASQRTGTLTIAGQTFTVTQEGAVTCTYSISPTSQSFGASGGSGSVSVTTNSNICSWLAYSNVSWITITSGSSGTGNGTVYYTIVANTSSSSRTGTITVHGAYSYIFTATQSGVSPQVERITNGSFSSGSSGWTLWGDFWAGTNLTNYRTAPGYAAGGVDSGGYAKNGANGSLYQTVTIPSNATAATLSFWYYIISAEVSGSYDTLSVTILNSSGNYLATVAVLGNADKGTSYSQKTFNATSYKGQTIRVNFLATTDSGNTTVFRIDDVSLMSDGN